MSARNLTSIGLVIASMSLAMPLLIGMIHVSSRLYVHGLAAVAGCFFVWAVAATFLIYHFVGKTREERKD